MANGDTKTESYLRAAAEGTRADLPSDTCCNTKTQNLILGVANRIMDVEDEVEELKNNPDVVDIVDTYQDLQNYDTSTLTDKDVIRVLADEQHDGQSTYYRWDEQSSAWTYIGAVGDYYTKGQVDTLLADKQDKLTAGTNVAITQVNDDLVISATDTTYSDFVGTDGVDAGAAGLVPAPTTADAGKFLKADGTWDTAGGGGGPTVVQTTGTSQTDVMSQNAAGLMVYADPGSDTQVRIGYNATTPGTNGIVIGNGAYNAISSSNNISIGPNAGCGRVNTYDDIAIGDLASVQSHSSIAIGRSAKVGTSIQGSIALGAYSTATRKGEINVGTSWNATGYNDTAYRVIGGVHDGADAHDAATVGQLSYRQKKPVTVWEVDGTTVTTGLVGLGEDISANPNWQLTDLDLTPFARIKIYSKAAQKAGTTASASTTPAIVLEMSLDPRAAIAEYGGNYVGSTVVQKPNDPNRLCTLCCTVSADKTKFEVLRMTNLYGTAATSNSDVNAYVFKIEGYYE